MALQQGVIENKNREIAVLSKQLNSAMDQVSALKSSATNLRNEKVSAFNMVVNSRHLLTFQWS